MLHYQNIPQHGRVFDFCPQYSQTHAESSPDTVSNFSVSQCDHTCSMVGCHNNFSTASPQRDYMSVDPQSVTTWQTRVGDGPHLTVAHPARQDMCQVILYSETNNTNSCRTSRVDSCVLLFLCRVSNRRSWKQSARLFTHISIST